MENIKLKGAISRIMSDLVKLDSVITALELDFLDSVYNRYGVTQQDRKIGFYMSLEEAVSIIASQSEGFKREIYRLMEEGARADGLCSRPEALLLMAVSSSCGLNANARGRVYSYESKGIPLHRDQLIYVSREDRNDRSLLSDMEVYDDVNNLVRLAGFELVYVPRIARHFETYDATDVLRKVLTLVRPTLAGSEDELIRQLRVMTPYKFYTSILDRKLKMSTLKVEGPCWLVKLGGSQVAGVEHANFLLLNINPNRLKLQLKNFMSEFLRLQPEQMVPVSSVELDENNFRYGGFIKSILDMISLGTEERWDVVIRLKDCKTFIDGDGKQQKAAISIRRGEEEWPLVFQDRDAAFYVLVLCATAEDPAGIELEKELEQGCAAQRRYEEIYRQLSIRNADCPNICFSETRRPIKSRLKKSVREHEYLTERDLYQLSGSQRKLFIMLNPSNVLVQGKGLNMNVERPLRESALYSTICRIV